MTGFLIVLWYHVAETLGGVYSTFQTSNCGPSLGMEKAGEASATHPKVALLDTFPTCLSLLLFFGTLFPQSDVLVSSSHVCVPETFHCCGG